MSKVTALYHIVFATKGRERTINKANADKLYRYIWSIITRNNCKLLRIGGMEDHLHILLLLHPAIALAALVRDIKSASSGWLVQSPDFPYFTAWASEYFAATLSWEDREKVIDYIKSQREHHLHLSQQEEFRRLVEQTGLIYHDNDFK